MSGWIYISFAFLHFNSWGCYDGSIKLQVILGMTDFVEDVGQSHMISINISMTLVDYCSEAKRVCLGEFTSEFPIKSHHRLVTICQVYHIVITAAIIPMRSPSQPPPTHAIKPLQKSNISAGWSVLVATGASTINTTWIWCDAMQNKLSIGKLLNGLCHNCLLNIPLLSLLERIAQLGCRISGFSVCVVDEFARGSSVVTQK